MYRQAAGFEFFADDYQWLVGAESFTIARLFNLAERNHFYRPLVDVYFPIALASCGRSVSCFHWISIMLHAVTCVLTAVLVGAVSQRRAVGVLAGLLLALHPGPVEAVIWVSAVGELLASAGFVLTVWLYYRAIATHSRWFHLGACAAFIGTLASHEAGVMLLPVLLLAARLPSPSSGVTLPPVVSMRRRLLLLVPCAGALLVSLAIAYSVNARNYVVTEGHYGVGLHVLTNIAGALVTFVVARRDLLSVSLISLLAVVALFRGPPRVRFYMAWALLGLLPFAGFRDGLSSRYLYLSAIGVAGVMAELLWSLWLRMAPWRLGVAAWVLLVVVLAGRFGVFAAKNIQTWAHVGSPYTEYAARVRALHVSPQRGSRIEVPPPPQAVPPHLVRPLLQWVYEDVTLDVVIAPPIS